MTRARGEGSLYRRASDGLWIGVVPYQSEGRTQRRTVSARTQKEARAKWVRLRAEISAGVLTDSTSVQQWVMYWLDNIAPRRARARTLQGYRGYVATWIVPQLGHYRLDRLGPEHIRRMVVTMERAGRSPATVRQCYAILHRALVVAVKEGRLMHNPADRMVDSPRPAKHPRTPLTLPEARAVIVYALGCDPGTSSRLLCALLQGLRQGEALGLRWEDVDLDGGTLTIRRAVQRQTGRGLVVVPVKSEASERRVPLLPATLAELVRHKEASGGRGYVWGGRMPTQPEADHRAWKAALSAAGVEPHPLHAARNTTGSLLDEAGVTPHVIAAILGHASVRVTSDHYISADEARLRAAVLDLSRLLDVSRATLPPSS